MSASSAAAAYGLSHLKQLAVAVARGRGGRAASGPVVLLGAGSSRFFAAAMTHIALQTALAAAFLALLRLAAEPDEACAARSRRPTSCSRAPPFSRSCALAFGSLTGPFRLDLAARRRRASRPSWRRPRCASPRSASAIAAAGVLVLAALVLWPPLTRSPTAGSGDVDRHRFAPERSRPLRHRGARSAASRIAALAGARLLRARDLPFLPPPATRAPRRSRRSAGSPSPICASRKAPLRCRSRSPPPRPRSAFAAGGWLFLTALARESQRADPARPRRAGLGRHRGGRARARVRARRRHADRGARARRGRHRVRRGPPRAHGAALVRRRLGHPRSAPASPGIRASSAATCRRRRSSTGCCSATAFRPLVLRGGRTA